MVKNTLLFALIGAAAGLALAHFYPDLGLGKGERFAAGLGRALGDDKPYVRNAMVGAIAGAAAAFISKK